jgi:hypothetical protein
MHRGIFNLLQYFAGGRLFHCAICRIQFYDRRCKRASVVSTA